MTRKLTVSTLGLMLALAGAGHAHNLTTLTDCPVLTLKQATAKPDIMFSLDESGSMGCCGRDADQRAVVKMIVADPIVGGQAINYGLMMWSSSGSQGTGDCRNRRYVDIGHDLDNTAPITTWQNSNQWQVYGGTPTNLALVEARNYFRDILIPNDTIQCRKRYVLMITDGGWNCTGDPCPTASTYVPIGVKIIAVAAFGVNISAVQCLATNSGGVAVQASNRQQLLDVLRQILGTTLSGTVTTSPGVAATLKDFSDPRLATMTDNALLVTPVQLPSFQGEFKAFKIYDPIPNSNKVQDVYTVMWDGGARTNSVNWSARNWLFTQDKWATCYRDPSVPTRPNCSTTSPPSGGFNAVRMDTTLANDSNAMNYLQVSDNGAARSLIDYLRGRQLFCGSPPRVCDATNFGAPWVPQNTNKPFKLYASISEGGSVMIPPGKHSPYTSDISWVSFENAYRTRPIIYFVESESGGVSAFEAYGANAGLERWLFIPRENLSRLKNHIITPNTIDKYTYFGHGRTVVYNQKTSQGWRSILMFGLGAAGRSYYGLDVSDSASWNPSGGVFPEILWAFTDDDNHTGGELNKFVLQESDFGTTGQSWSVPAAWDPTNVTGQVPVVFGSGYANNHLLQPDLCIGPAITNPDVGHSMYRLNAETGHLTGVAAVTNVNVGGTPAHDILRGQVNAITNMAIEGDPEVEGVNDAGGNPLPFRFKEHYVMGGTQGHLFLWDGATDQPGSPTIKHITSARTSAETDSVLTQRAIVRQPLIIAPRIGELPCPNGNRDVSLAGYFGTGDDGVTRVQPPATPPTQYLFAVDLSDVNPAQSMTYPTYTQLPGSPIALGSREIMVGDPRYARVKDPANPASEYTIVTMLTFTSASNACGSGFSSLRQFKACDFRTGGFDCNGDGNVTAADRVCDLGSGRATACEISNGKLIVTQASGVHDFSRCDPTLACGDSGPNGVGCCIELPSPPSSTIWNYKIKD